MTATADLRQDALDAMHLYCHALDTRDWGLLRSVLTDEMRFAGRLCDKGVPQPDQVALEGREAFVSLLQHIWAGLAGTQHTLSNHIVKLTENGQAATIVCCVRAYHAGDGARADMFEESLGRFDVEMVRQLDGWKIDRLEESMYVILGSMEVLSGPA